MLLVGWLAGWLVGWWGLANTCCSLVGVAAGGCWLHLMKGCPGTSGCEDSNTGCVAIRDAAIEDTANWLEV